MRATVMYAAGDVRVVDVADPIIRAPTDVVLRITRACICGSDLWPYRNMDASDEGARMGHEFIGVVEDVGGEVRTLRKGDVAIAPFVWSDGSCVFCQEGLPTSCENGGFWGAGDVDAGQGEAVRVPLADATLVAVPVDEDDERMASLLTLSDVFGTGHHAAVSAGVEPGCTAAVVGDGAVGLCGVLAAKRLGAERVILLGRHADRQAIGRDFGATDIVAVRGDEAVEQVRALTAGRGAECVLECVGLEEAFKTAVGITRPGGRIGRVGAPQFQALPQARQTFLSNITVSGGLAPVRAYIEQLLPDVLDGKIEPGKVFDRVVGLDEVPAGYDAMQAREAIKVLVTP